MNDTFQKYFWTLFPLRGRSRRFPPNDTLMFPVITGARDGAQTSLMRFTPRLEAVSRPDPFKHVREESETGWSLEVEDENLEVVSSHCRTAQSISQDLKNTWTFRSDLTQLILTTNKLNPGDTVARSATSTWPGWKVLLDSSWWAGAESVCWRKSRNPFCKLGLERIEFQHIS